jgi:hypothetical protein
VCTHQFAFFHGIQKLHLRRFGTPAALHGCELLRRAGCQRTFDRLQHPQVEQSASANHSACR